MDCSRSGSRRSSRDVAAASSKAFSRRCELFSASLRGVMSMTSPFQNHVSIVRVRHRPAHFPDPFGLPVGGHDLEFQLHLGAFFQALFSSFSGFRAGMRAG